MGNPHNSEDIPYRCDRCGRSLTPREAYLTLNDEEIVILCMDCIHTWRKR